MGSEKLATKQRGRISIRVMYNLFRSSRMPRRLACGVQFLQVIYVGSLEMDYHT